MPIRLPRGTKLKTEKPVLANPVPIHYRPANSIPYPVTDHDMRGGWKWIARKHGVDVRMLIDFNFKTSNPDEVNWYLRRNTGCDTATDDRLNWVFSSTAHPGIIYIPINKMDFQPSEISVTRPLDDVSTGFYWTSESEPSKTRR